MARRNERAEARDCGYCGESFRPWKANGRFCSRICAQRAASQRRLTALALERPGSHDLAWAAGFFDGEGCFTSNSGVSYDTSEGIKTRRYLKLSVSQKYEPLVSKLQSIFGVGSVYFAPARKTSSQAYVWRCHGRAAFYVADLLWPWLGEQKKADFKRALKLARESRLDFVRRGQYGRRVVAKKEL